MCQNLRPASYKWACRRHLLPPLRHKQLEVYLSMTSSPLQLGISLGVVFLGNIGAAIFYGITSVQTFVYYQHSQTDTILLKIMVFALWILDGVHLAFITSGVYTYAISDFADPIRLLTITWTMMAHILTTSIIELIVRCLFCQRVWRLGSKKSTGLAVLCLTIFVSNLVSSVSTAGFAIRGFMTVDFVRLTALSWVFYTGFSCGIVADGLTTISICVLLKKRRSGFSRTTDSALRVLMLYSINTGSLNCMCMIACLVTYATMSTPFTTLAIYFMLPKLSLNALLATFNARQSLYKSRADAVVSAIPLTTMNVSSGVTNDEHSQRFVGKMYNDKDLKIQVQTTTEIKVDET
ncbi:hypothetical protein BKA93DRAFT_789474, partial [Sparassis latifolia]